MTDKADFGWDEALPPPREFALLPEGDAKFEVLKLERVRKDMGKKLGTCNVAVLSLLVTSYIDPENPLPIEVNLPLSHLIVFKLYQFFAAIGQYTHGDVEAGKPFQPNWNEVVGSTGLCVVKHRPWKGRDGVERHDNDIEAYLDDQGRTRATDDPRVVGGQEAAGADNLQF